jgi:nitrous oxidase accessory protein
MREDAGILVRSDANRIHHNEIRDILFGIYLLEADSNSIAGNTIVGRGALDYGQRGSGIHIWNSYDNAFEANTIFDARDGFYIQYASRTVIVGNMVFDTRYGVHYMYADSNDFSSNTFFRNVAGAAIMYSRGIRFRHNVFAHNRGFASYGLLFQDCHNVEADSNVIADNVVGMFFESSTNNVFRHNIIAQNDLALKMFQNSEGNMFSENNFIDNISPLVIVGRRTESQWNDRGRGNYWSTYSGYDLDSDGIGDVPMKIQNVFGFLEAQSPNVRLYLYSPAAQALAVASSAFPIVEVNREIDEFPLMRALDLNSMPAVTLMPKRDSARSGLTVLLTVAGLVSMGVIGVVSRREK